MVETTKSSHKPPKVFGNKPLTTNTHIYDDNATNELGIIVFLTKSKKVITLSLQASINLYEYDTTYNDNNPNIDIGGLSYNLLSKYMIGTTNKNKILGYNTKFLILPVAVTEDLTTSKHDKIRVSNRPIRVNVTIYSGSRSPNHK